VHSEEDEENARSVDWGINRKREQGTDGCGLYSNPYEGFLPFV